LDILATKIKKDVNKYYSGGTRDVLAIYFNELRHYIRKSVPGFELLGQQKDRTRVSGILYQLTAICKNCNLADLCFLYSLLHYDNLNEFKKTNDNISIGQMVAYLFCMYRYSQFISVDFCQMYKFNVVHISIMLEDFIALGLFDINQQYLWNEAEYNNISVLPIELAYYNAYKCPSKNSITCFILCCIEAGILDVTPLPMEWTEQFHKRVDTIRLILIHYLKTGFIHKLYGVLLRIELLFTNNVEKKISYYISILKNDNIQNNQLNEAVDCNTYINKNIRNAIWNIYKQNYNDVCIITKNEIFQLLLNLYSDIDISLYTKPRYILEFEGVLDTIRVSLGPPLMHMCGYLNHFLQKDEPVYFVDNMFMYKTNMFKGSFFSLVKDFIISFDNNINNNTLITTQHFKIIAPICLFNCLEIYIFMKLLGYLKSNINLVSFFNQCRYAKKQLTGNAIRNINTITFRKRKISYENIINEKKKC